MALANHKGAEFVTVSVRHAGGFGLQSLLGQQPWQRGQPPSVQPLAQPRLEPPGHAASSQPAGLLQPAPETVVH